MWSVDYDNTAFVMPPVGRQTSFISKLLIVLSLAFLRWQHVTISDKRLLCTPHCGESFRGIWYALWTQKVSGGIREWDLISQRNYPRFEGRGMGQERCHKQLVSAPESASSAHLHASREVQGPDIVSIMPYIHNKLRLGFPTEAESALGKIYRYIWVHVSYGS